MRIAARSRGEVLDAIQWWPANTNAGVYYDYGAEVFKILTKHSKLTIRPGDYIIIFPDGTKAPVREELFNLLFDVLQ